MHTKQADPYPKEKSLEGRSGVRAHVLNCDVWQTVEQQQREASNWLEPLATDEKHLPWLLLTEPEQAGSLSCRRELFPVKCYNLTMSYTCTLHHTLYNVLCPAKIFQVLFRFFLLLLYKLDLSVCKPRSVAGSLRFQVWDLSEKCLHWIHGINPKEAVHLACLYEPCRFSYIKL